MDRSRNRVRAVSWGPIVAVRLGVDPRGFIGKLQGLSGGWSTAPLGIIKILMDKDPMIVDYFVKAVQGCESYDQANRLAELVPNIRSLTEDQVSRLVEAFNTNSQVNGSYGFNGRRPNQHRAGLAQFLTRVRGEEYQIWNGHISAISPDQLLLPE